MTNPEPDPIIGYTWTNHRLVDDGAGGKILEPQDRVPVRVTDLDPALRGVVLRALEASA